MQRTARCECGQATAVCEGEPMRVSVCHCHACQRRTGSAFGVQARWPADKVQVAGQFSEYRRTGDGGGRITFRFCPTCGTTLWYMLDPLPGFVVVAVGAFGDAMFPAPTFSVYEERAHGWAIPKAHGIERWD